MLFKPEHMHMETYRSGHNGAHSKCVSPLPGSRVRIPPSPLEKPPQAKLSFAAVFVAVYS